MMSSSVIYTGARQDSLGLAAHSFACRLQAGPANKQTLEKITGQKILDSIQCPDKREVCGEMLTPASASSRNWPL